MAVRDEGLAGQEIGGGLGLLRRIGDGPQPVPQPVLRRGGEQRGPPGRPLDDRRRAGLRTVTRIGEEQRFEVGAGGAHQGGPVRHDVVHHLLVREDDPVGGGGERQGADQAALEDAVAALLVDVERGFGIGGEHALGEPLVQGPGRQPVAGCGGAVLRQDQPHDVVRVRRLQVVQAVRTHHHVVRRGRHRGEAAHPLGDVTHAAEGEQAQPLPGAALPEACLRGAALRGVPRLSGVLLPGVPRCVHPRIVGAGCRCGMIGAEASNEERTQ